MVELPSPRDTEISGHASTFPVDRTGPFIPGIPKDFRSGTRPRIVGGQGWICTNLLDYTPICTRADLQSAGVTYPKRLIYYSTPAPNLSSGIASSQSSAFGSKSNRMTAFRFKAAFKASAKDSPSFSLSPSPE